MMLVGYEKKVNETGMYKIFVSKEARILSVTEDKLKELINKRAKISNIEAVENYRIDNETRIVKIVDGKVLSSQCIMGKVGKYYLCVDTNWSLKLITDKEKLTDTMVHSQVSYRMTIHNLLKLLSKISSNIEPNANQRSQYAGTLISNDTIKSVTHRGTSTSNAHTFISINGKLVKITASKLDDITPDKITKKFGLYTFNDVPCARQYYYKNTQASEDDIKELLEYSDNLETLIRFPGVSGLCLRDKLNSNRTVDLTTLDEQQRNTIERKLKRINLKGIVYNSNLNFNDQSILLTRVVTNKGIKYKVVQYTQGRRNYDSETITVTIENVYKNSHLYTNLVRQGDKFTIYGLDGVYEYDINKIYDTYKTRPVELSPIALTNRMLGKAYIEEINTRGELLKLEGDSQILNIDDRCKVILRDSIKINKNNKILIIPPTVRNIHIASISSVEYSTDYLTIKLNGEGILKQTLDAIRRLHYARLQITKLNMKDAKAIGSLYNWKFKSSDNIIEMSEDAELINYEVMREMLRVLSVEVLGSFSIFGREASSPKILIFIRDNYLNLWKNVREFILKHLYNNSDKQAQKFIEQFIGHIEEKNKSLR